MKNKFEQLEFLETETINQELYICDKCAICTLECKIYSISKSTVVYCRNYKKENK